MAAAAVAEAAVAAATVVAVVVADVATKSKSDRQDDKTTIPQRKQIAAVFFCVRVTPAVPVGR
jgi:hypothetical protein